MYEDDEVWAKIPGTTGYEFSTWGRCRSYWTTSRKVLDAEPHLLNLSTKHRKDRSTPNATYVLKVDGAKVERTPARLLREVFNKFRCGNVRSNKYGCGKLLPIEDKHYERHLCVGCAKTKAKYEQVAHLYGLTPRQYDDMKWEAEEKCRICNEVLPLVVDHNSKTGKVRGLLCGPHNLGIGHFDHRPELLEAAAEYLRKTDN